MNQIASARPERAIQIASDLLNRREEVKRFIWIVVIAGIALSFIINIFSTFIWENLNCLWVALITSILIIILGFCIYWAFKSYAGDVYQSIFFELLLPFRAYAELEALNGRYYKIIDSEFRRRTEFLLKCDKQIVTHIKEDWETVINRNLKTLEEKDVPHLLTFLHDLTEFFILTTLNNFSKKYMTLSANYQEFGWIRPVYKKKKYSFAKEMKAVKQSNLLFQLIKKDVPKNLFFLDDFTFKHQPQSAQKKDGKSYFEFTSKYGNFRFTISPFPIIVPEGWRDSVLISRYCNTKEKDIRAIKIPFALEFNFRGVKIVSKEFRQIYAPLLEDLVNYFQHSLDWQYCAQHDMERMVVELLGKED